MATESHEPELSELTQGRTALERQQTTEAAFALFLRNGYGKTSMDQPQNAPGGCGWPKGCNALPGWSRSSVSAPGGTSARASRPDQMWALDFQVDVTVDGRQIRFLNIIDEFTRVALATRAVRSFTADATVAVLDQLVTDLGRRPEHIRMDNGPELTARALRVPPPG